MRFVREYASFKVKQVNTRASIGQYTKEEQAEKLKRIEKIVNCHNYNMILTDEAMRELASI